MSAFDQQRLYGTTGFVFKDPAAKYKVQINTLAGRLQYETTKNEELEMARVQDLRRMPHVTDVQAQLEKQRELAAAYSNEISALSGDRATVEDGLVETQNTNVCAEKEARCTKCQ